MKKLVIAILLCLGIVLSAFTVEYVYYPQNVKEIISAEYSTGGGDSMIIYVEVFCKMDDGTYRIFFAEKITASSFFNMSRLDLPDYIVLKKKEGLYNKIIWE